jgi:hypothetical protein
VLLLCCLEFLFTRRSAALPAAILSWHALTFSVPALQAVTDGRRAMLQEWDALAYQRIAGKAWLVAWLPLMLTLLLLGLLAMRARVRAATEAVQSAGARAHPALRDRSAARMERAVRTSDALAAADLCGSLAHTLEVAAPLLLPVLPPLNSAAPVMGVGVAIGLLLAFYPLLFLVNLRLRARHRTVGEALCTPYGRLFPWAVRLLLATALGLRLWLCWMLPPSYRLVLGLALQTCSALATLFMLQCIKRASRSQLRMLHRTLRGGAYHPVPARLHSVLRQRDAADIEAMLRGCNVRIKGAVMRRRLSRRQRCLAGAGRWASWARGTRLGGWVARLGASALRLLSLARVCCPAPSWAERTAPAAVGRRSPPKRTSAVPVSVALSWRGSQTALSADSPHNDGPDASSLLQRLSRRVRGTVSSLAAAADGDEWSVSTSTQHAATIQLSPDFSCILISPPSRAGSSRVLHRGHELMPMRLESAAAVSQLDLAPGALSITFRRAGSTPAFVSVLRFNRAADAQPWLALAKLLAAPPEALPRRWRALYFRSFAASCAEPALGLAVPAELDAFLRRLNIEPQVALAHGTREAVQPLGSHATFARVCTLLRPLVTCRPLDDQMRALGAGAGADGGGLTRDTFLRLMRSLRRPGPADARKDAEASDIRRRRWDVAPVDDEDSVRSHSSADALPSSGSALRRRRACCAERPASSPGSRPRRPDNEWAYFGLGEAAILKIISTRAEVDLGHNPSPVAPPGRAPWSISTASGPVSDGPSDRRSVDSPYRLREGDTAAAALPVAPTATASPHRPPACIEHRAPASPHHPPACIELSSPRGGGRRFAQLTEALLAKLSGVSGSMTCAGYDAPPPAPASSGGGLGRLKPPAPPAGAAAAAQWRALCASVSPRTRRPPGRGPSSPLQTRSDAERGNSPSAKASPWANTRRGGGAGGVAPGSVAIRRARDDSHGPAAVGMLTAMHSIRWRLRPGHASEPGTGRDRASRGSLGAHSPHTATSGPPPASRGGTQGTHADEEAEARTAFAAHASRVHGTLRIPRDELLGVVADPQLNGAMHPRESRVWQDMRQPLAHYLIFSSHNTCANANILPRNLTSLP